MDSGGWKSIEVIERVYSKVRSAEVVPETRTAVACASSRFEMEEFPTASEVDLVLVDEGEFGLSRDHYARR